MTALTDTNRSLLTALRRVLLAVWRVLNLASQVVDVLIRGAVVIAFITAVVAAVRFGCGQLMALGTVFAWITVGAALIVRDPGGRR